MTQFLQYIGLVINSVNIDWKETCFGNYQMKYYGPTLYEWPTSSFVMHSSLSSPVCRGVVICHLFFYNNYIGYALHPMILKTHNSNLTIKFNTNFNNKYLIYLIDYSLSSGVWNMSTAMKIPNCNHTIFDSICLNLTDRHIIYCWYKIMKKWKDYYLKW